jgi:hypothetical protein
MNYNETTLSGSSWVRCNYISISNLLQDYEDINAVAMPSGVNIDKTPLISFSEETVVTLQNNKVLRTPLGGQSLVKRFNITETFPVLNPETNLPTGQTLSHQDLYVYLYSLYIQTATERDAQNAAP